MAVGIVLSGTASDGTLGIEAIKEHNGITFAQDPSTAAYVDMPENAIESGNVDFIMAPNAMPGKLVELFGSQGQEGTAKNDQHSEETIYQQIISILRQHSGVDFTYYKQTTIRRRVARRMSLCKCETLGKYLKALRKSKEEQESLFSDLLIPVTSFFRNPEIFKYLHDNVLPKVIKNKIPDESLRIWTAGCSTGQEAYSIAITIHEFLAESHTNLKGNYVQLFASDISPAAIAKARAGTYTKSELKGVSTTILKKYFTKNEGGYQVIRPIRDMCVFAVHNFLKDPPFSKMDLISCRNVLIYMDTFLQKKALSTFHYALNKNGILFLGKSETTGPASELFNTFSKNEKIFQRKNIPGRFISVPTIKNEIKKTRLPINERTNLHLSLRPEVQKTDFRKNAESLLLSLYTPACVIVNEQTDIVHIHGNISPFLEASQGKPTFNLIKMARQGLAFELRNILHKARTTNTKISKSGIPIVSNDKQMSVTLEVVPLTNTAEPHYMILFKAEEIEHVKLTVVPTDDAAQMRIDQLIKELADMHEDMRSITEDQEAINEELQSANEELLSSNEEMQSLNEEMETSKEELQSTNEELIIVNQELIDKQEQINASRQYAEAIIATLREPLLILDRTLHIKTANAAFYKKFNCTAEETEGNFIYEFRNGIFNSQALQSLLENILPKQMKLIDYDLSIHMPATEDRIMLLNAWQIVSQKIAEKLIIIAFEDITELKIAEERKKIFLDELESSNGILQRMNIELKEVNVSKNKFISIISHDLRNPLSNIVMASQLLKGATGREEAEVKTFSEIIYSSSTNMLKQLDELVQWSIQKEKTIKFNPQIKNLNEFVNAAKVLIKDVANQKKIELINTIEKSMYVNADPLLLRSIFQNLISNSIKFTPEGGRVEIHAKTVGNSQIEVAIHDTGIGMNDAAQAKLFSDEAILVGNETQSNNSGLGLLLVKDFVEKHSGQIRVESELNKGTTIYFTLPEAQHPS